MPDSPEYKNKKAYFDALLTIYGRKPVLEALENSEVEAIKLHLSEKNRPAKIIEDIIELAEKRQTEVCYHNAAALSRISKNAKQDQGVALDARCPNFQSLDDLLSKPEASNTLIALDQITNPQNLGMIIRSVTASQADALLIPRKGCAPLNSLVIKASAGALFKAPIVYVEDLKSALAKCKKKGYQLASLEVDGKQSLFDFKAKSPTLFVLGNETEGVSREISNQCDLKLSIPMHRGVESLNVAIAAALIAFL